MIHKLTVGSFGSNCFIVEHPDSSDAVVIDPGGEEDRILETLSENEIQPDLIIATHGHIDHIAAVSVLKKEYNIPFAIHLADQYLVEGLPDQAKMFGVQPPDVPEIDRDLDGEKQLQIGSLAFDLVHTPGHSPGGVTLVMEEEDSDSPDHLFVGDCIFAGSIGRTDFPKASRSSLEESLKKIISYPDNSRLHPGHGPDTTIEQEKSTNPFL